jgi:hypothetical protein
MRFENIPTWAEWQKASSSFMTIRASKPKLVRIDNLIKKYHQVFEMSKLNILMELKTAIADWAADKIDRAVTTGRLPAMQALEEIVVRKLYELDGWGKHRYIKAVCIGYKIKTGDYDHTKKPANEQQRRKDETVEIGSRVRTLVTAIQLAHSRYTTYASLQHISPDEEDKTLKIFMAPEFFFRGPYGAYADIGWCAKIMEMMRTETSKGEYADWLFVHGTALFASDKYEKGKRVGALLENYALVQKGGPKTREHQDHVIAKEFPSHVDFQHPTIGDGQWYDPQTSKAAIGGVIRRNIMPEGGRKDPIYKPLGDPSGSPSASVSELTGGVVFTMDGITFGLEVCRDHYLKRLAHSQENGKVLIQLIPSAGMGIEAASIACVPGGLVFNVDGVTPHVQAALRPPGGALKSVMTANSGGGQIVIFDPQRIEWPGLVRLDVAQRLGMSQGVLSGTARILPLPPMPKR